LVLREVLRGFGDPLLTTSSTTLARRHRSLCRPASGSCSPAKSPGSSTPTKTGQPSVTWRRSSGSTASPVPTTGRTRHPAHSGRDPSPYELRCHFKSSGWLGSALRIPRHVVRPHEVRDGSGPRRARGVYLADRAGLDRRQLDTHDPSRRNSQILWIGVFRRRSVGCSIGRFVRPVCRW